jgi:hypothetical protein
MFVRFETPTKQFDGSWTAPSELVNMDHVIRVWVKGQDTSGVKFQALHLEVDGGVDLGPYYFGPGDMKPHEVTTRLVELTSGLSDGGVKVVLSMRDDAKARQASAGLPPVLLQPAS